MLTPRVTRHLLAGATFAGALACGTAAAASTVPPDDTSGGGNQEALDQFVALAESRGYTLTDPACAATPTADTDETYTCYGITGTGEAFIARTSLDQTDVIEFEILAEPTQTLGPSAPDEAGSTTTTATTEPTSAFDPLAYFAAMFSGDVNQQAALEPLTAPGSPADAYLRYQTEANETRGEYDVAPVEPANVYLTPHGVTVCLTPDDCVEVADLQVIDGQLTNFTVDDNPIAPRLGRPGPVITIGTNTAQVRAAYRTVSTDALSVFVEVSATNADVFEFSAAVYVAADGTQTPIDAKASMVSTNLTMKGTHTIDLRFPRADPGGTLRFVVYPADGSEPLAAVLPIDPIS